MKKFYSIIFLHCLIIFLFVGCMIGETEPDIVSIDFFENSSTHWVEYDRDSFDNIYFYDEGNIKYGINNENGVHVREKEVFSDKGKLNVIQEFGDRGGKYSKVSHLYSFFEINCKNKENRLFSMSVIDRDGNVLHSRSHKNTEWEPVSKREILRKKVCK